MPLARHHHIASNIEDAEAKRKDRSSNGAGGIHGIKINFSNMVDELRLKGQSQNENEFVEKLLKSEIPSRDDVLSVNSNKTFIRSIINNMSKRIIFLYKDIDVIIDEYLASEEDKYVMKEREFGQQADDEFSNPSEFPSQTEEEYYNPGGGSDDVPQNKEEFSNPNQGEFAQM